jgi:flagellin-like protein
LAIEGEKLTKNSQTHANPSSKKLQRRAVAPVIATLLLVAIAVVGGSIIFVFSQVIFSSTQVSGLPEPELVKIVGYDLRDVSPVKAHNGLDIMPANCCGIADGTRNPDERITIYIQNNSINTITISELRFGGAVYQYATYTKLGPWQADPIGTQQGEYVIMTGNDGTSPPNDLSQEGSPRIKAGELVTLVLDLDSTLNNGRDMQVKLTTGNGNVFVTTIFTGSNVI